MNIKNYVGIETLEAKFGPMSVGLFIHSFREADCIPSSGSLFFVCEGLDKVILTQGLLAGPETRRLPYET